MTFQKSKYEYFTLDSFYSHGFSRQRRVVHKIVGEVCEQECFEGYKLACGTALANGEGFFTLGVIKDRKGTASHEVNKIENKRLCPICFPNGIEQE